MHLTEKKMCTETGFLRIYHMKYHEFRMPTNELKKAYSLRVAKSIECYCFLSDVRQWQVLHVGSRSIWTALYSGWTVCWHRWDPPDCPAPACPRGLAEVHCPRPLHTPSQVIPCHMDLFRCQTSCYLSCTMYLSISVSITSLVRDLTICIIVKITKLGICQKTFTNWLYAVRKVYHDTDHKRDRL